MTADGAPSTTEPRAPVRAKNALVAFALLAALVAFGASWVSARNRAKLLTTALYSTAVELSECARAASGDAAALRDGLELLPADSAPLSGCAPLAASAHARLGELAALRFPRDKDGLRELRAIAAALPETRFRERTDTLIAGEPESLESGLGALVKGACRLALGEGSVEPGACPPVARPFPSHTLPSARVVLDEPAEFLLTTAFAVAPGEEGELRLTFATRERDSDSVGLRLGQSKDAGASFGFIAGRTGPTEGTPNLPAVSFGGGAPELMLVSLRDEKAAYKGAWIARVAQGGERLEPAVEVPALPEGLEPLRAGTPLWLSGAPKKPALPTLAIGPRDPARVGGALVRLLPAGKLELVPAPPGTLVAATTLPKPRLLLREGAADAAGALALYEVPASGDPWPSPERIALGPGAVVAEAASEAACGVSGEKWFPFVARHAQRSLFVAVGARRMFALPFDAPAEHALGRVCGTCAPSLLTRGEDQLGLVIPVGNQMTPMPVGAPFLVTGTRSGKHSVATCERDVVLFAHLAQDRIWVQSTRAGSWQVGRPTLLAARNEHGAPVDVRVAATGGKLFVFWRRDLRMRLRVEVLVSDDGGVTWR